ncbi:MULTISPECIES: hypothetical protein [Staphylococcus]|uniref:hypothetical protein n=1 Tax=Staphylococcus TaxID=1279 RepID=UPI001E40B833|nr:MULTISPECIES: hypothetical protein [Staphylococcus]MCD9063914.1 hypothetical protein [Staphylococcus saprophyticus]MDK1671593.1 hypothetical protein [Staphylococcus saprophyticus]MDW3796075.1 hypothetical protein [Staphylococcus saprophyticus]MDW3798610.1 hypothetical protein [Staphylococcus saprophyticus]MDW3828829.1 hypothetical protein [Staphylococcus saprophyticus]
MATSDPLSVSIGSLLRAMASSSLDISKGVYINIKSVKIAAGNYVFQGTNWGYQ